MIIRTLIRQYSPYTLLMLLLLGCSFWLLNQCTGLYCDDYPYAFFMNDDGSFDLSHRVEGIMDIVKSQYHHYLFLHGRVLAIGLDQWFLSLGNKNYFNVCNALVFVGYVYFMQKVSRHRGLAGLVFTVIILFLFFRAFGEVFLWQTGCLNYLWSGFFNLAFLFVLEKNKNSNNIVVGLWAVILSIVAGWWQECFSVGISAALASCFLLLLWNRKKMAVVPFIMGAGYIFGTLLYVFAPGTLDRAAREGVSFMSVISHIGANVMYVLTGLRVFWLFIVVLIVQVIRGRCKYDFIHQNGFLLTATFFEIFFLMLLGRTAMSRAFFGVETLSLVILLRVIPLTTKRMREAFLAVLLLLLYCPVLYLSWKNHQTTQAFMKEMESSDGLVFFDMPRYSHVEKHYLGSLLVMDHRSTLFFREAAYYGKQRLMVLPRHCYDDLYLSSSLICRKNEIRQNEYCTADMNFTVSPFPQDKPLPLSVNGFEYVSFPSGKYVLKNRKKNGAT